MEWHLVCEDVEVVKNRKWRESKCRPERRMADEGDHIQFVSLVHTFRQRHDKGGSLGREMEVVLRSQQQLDTPQASRGLWNGVEISPFGGHRRSFL